MDYLEALRQSPYIKEKKLDNHISSFNFTRKAFWDKHWSNMSIKARGLFIDTRFHRVKARSYDKFFHVGERRDTELPQIANWDDYGLLVYVKENGYLGICSWEEDGSLFCASKSTTEGWFAQRFRELLVETLGDKVQDFNQALRNENLSAVFEVIDPENDAHIIEYDKPQVILLDLIYNELEPGEIEFVNKSYEILKMWGYRFGLRIKEQVCCLRDYDDLVNFYNMVTAPGYQYLGRYVEGFVIEDMGGQRHVKVKTEYYTFWKQIRRAITCARQNKKFNDEWIDKDSHPEFSDLISFIEKKAPEYYQMYETDIGVIELRHMWEEYNDFCNQRSAF